MSCEELLVERLRSRGMRMTPQRELVLAALHELQGHATVQEAHEHISNVSDSVEKTTVYRSLELLVELGLVIRVDMGDNVLHYSLADHGPHVHVICDSCGRVLQTEAQGLEHLREIVMQETDLLLGNHQVLHGVCRDCQLQQKAS